MTQSLVPLNSSHGDDAMLITALASGATHADAARRSGVSERTVRRRLQAPSFQAEVDRARTETLRAVSSALRSQAVRAVATLGELLDDSQPPMVRLGAVRTMLDHLIRYQHAADFEERLAELEESVHAASGSRT